MVDFLILRSLSDEDRRRVLASARRRRFAKGEVVFHEGDPGDTIHLVAKGKVVVKVTTPNGDTASLAVLVAGQYVGELALVAGHNTRTATVVALEPTETLSIHRHAFDELRRSDPHIQELLVTILSDQVQRTSALLLEARYVPADKRVLRRVNELAVLYAGLDGATVVPLTQEDVATLAATTRSTANRVLRRAEEAGLLSVDRGRLTITDTDGLARWAR